MKASILSIACFMALSASFAQGSRPVEYQYKNNTFSVSQQDKQLTNVSTGKLFYSRIQAFDSFNRKSLKPFMSKEMFVSYLEKFKGLTAIAMMNGYNDYIKAVETMYSNIKNLSKLSPNDDNTYALYEISAPMYKVMDESWGNDMVDAVVQEAYLNLYDYLDMKVSSGNREFTNAWKYVDMSPVKSNETGTCQYTVSIDKPVLRKDNIEVYFSDLAMFKKISKRYTGQLVQGPVPAWQSMKDESDVVHALLQAYEAKKDKPAYNVHMYKLKDYGNPATVQQNLLKDKKWFVWVFRNGVLYYSYMTLPCADISKVTVYEERPQAGLEGADKNGGIQ